MNLTLLREMRCARLLDPGIIAVIRAASAEVVPRLGEALVAGGVIALEVTTSTPNFAAAIRAAKVALGENALVGAGPILNAEMCERALDAGAEFIVSPVLRLELVALGHAAGCPVMLGAGTATEAQSAYEAGADFVKLFPAEVLGPEFVRTVLAPLSHLRFVPTGGITLANAAAYRRAGCVAAGVGGSLVRSDLMARGDWTALTQLAGDFVRAWRS